MAVWLTIFAGAALPGQSEFEKDGVRVRVHIHSSIFRYEVMNLSAPPITSFEVGQHHGYYFQGPDGWEVGGDAGSLSGRAVDKSAAILPGKTGRFSFRVSSLGAVLGTVRGKLGFDFRDDIVMPEIWGAVPEPRDHVFTVAGTIVVVMLFHVFWLVWQERRKARASAV